MLLSRFAMKTAPALQSRDSSDGPSIALGRAHSVADRLAMGILCRNSAQPFPARATSRNTFVRRTPRFWRIVVSRASQCFAGAVRLCGWWRPRTLAWIAHWFASMGGDSARHHNSDGPQHSSPGAHPASDLVVRYR